MGPFGNVRLRTLVALLVLITTIPLGVLAAQLIRESWRDQITLANRQNIDAARAISLSVDQEVAAARGALRAYAALEFFVDPDLARIRHAAPSLLASQNGWRALLLAERSGGLVFRHPGDAPAGDSVATLPWFRKVIDTNAAAVSNLLVDDAGEHHFVLAVPVRRDGGVDHVLAAEIRAAALSELLAKQNPPPHAVVTLLDGQRRVMARTRNQAELIGGYPAPDFYDAAGRMTTGAWSAVLMEGTPAYAALRRSPVTGWTVGLGLPRDAIDAPIIRSLWSLTMIGMVILLAGLVSALLLSRAIVRAFESAGVAARDLASGKRVTATASPIIEATEFSRNLADASAALERRRTDRDQALAAEQRSRASSEASRAQLDVTLRSIGEAVVTTDANGIVTLLNPVAERLTGCREADAVGRPIGAVLGVIDEASRAPRDDIVSKALEAKAPIGIGPAAFLITPRGEVPIEDSASPILASDGNAIGVVIVFRDVTQKRETERRRRRLLEQEQAARAEAERLSQSKDDFIATVSHELRNPLNAIHGWVHLLKEGGLNDHDKAYAYDVIDRNTRLQSRLVEDLLDTSRIVAGRMELDMRPVALRSILDAAVDALYPSADEKELRLELATADCAGWVRGDADRLHQIVANLLTNAIRFTPRGGHVHVRLSEGDGAAVIEVKDTGIGITDALLPYIFERFRQGDSGPSRRHAGLGIGLALAHQLVALHGGTVSAESAGLERGATFTVRLPLADRAGADTVDADEEDTDLTAARVLVVDDDPDERTLIAMALGGAGATVTPAASVNEALDIIKAQSVDAVISDIAMPGRTGYDLVRELRRGQATRKTPMIALTAYRREEDKRIAIEAGFDRHLGKPFDPPALVRAVAGAIRMAAHS